MSTALYRRYRPETFADVIGQEHVTEPLMQALRTGRVGHAYLFSGPRGCGKTTSARILARCLNCEQGPRPDACGTCDSCVALARGGPGTVDVIEIDAASHGGVDDARDLRERASYGPAQSRYKVYIIDEAHMVTPQGFNALLKIVEEPPEHVKFVFATTEPEKVIGTIRSRTHHYPFRLVPPQRLQDYMEDLCRREGVTVAPGVLSFVVRAGGGSVRDSLSVLDQLIAGSGEAGLTYESAASLLGFTDGELLDAVIDAFAAGDGAGAFRAIERVVETGLDPRRFVEDLLERLRDLIVVTAVPEGAGAVLRALPADQLERMRAQAAAFGAGALSRAADIVNTGLTEMTGATAPRLQLELIAARILLPAASGESGYAARLDRLERRLAVEGVPTGARASAPGAAAAMPLSGAPASATPAPAAGMPVPPAPVQPVPARPAPAETGAPADRAHAAATADRAVGGGGDAGESRGRRGQTPAEIDRAPGGAPRPDPEALREQAHARADRRGEHAVPAEGPPEPVVEHEPDQPEHPQQPYAAPQDGPQGAAPQSQAPAQAGGGIDTATIRRHWADVLARVFELRRTTWTFLSEHAQVLDYDGERLLLGIATEGLAQTFRRGPHADYVRQALIDALGVDARVEGVPSDGRPPSGGGPSGDGAGGGGAGGADGGGFGSGPGAPGGGPAGPAGAERHSTGGDARGPAGPPPAPEARDGAAAPSRGFTADGPPPGRSGRPTGHSSGPTDGLRADVGVAVTAPPGGWEEPSGSWGSQPAPSDAPPSWATGPEPDPPAQSPDSGGAQGSEPAGGDTPAETTAPQPHVIDDSSVSDDDEDIVELGDVGIPVVERILGGKVIPQERPRR